MNTLLVKDGDQVWSTNPSTLGAWTFFDLRSGKNNAFDGSLMEPKMRIELTTYAFREY